MQMYIYLIIDSFQKSKMGEYLHLTEKSIKVSLSFPESEINTLEKKFPVVTEFRNSPYVTYDAGSLSRWMPLDCMESRCPAMQDF